MKHLFLMIAVLHAAILLSFGQSAGASKKRALYIAAIGVSHYKNYKDDSLKYAAKDARNVIDSFSASSFYSNVYKFLLTDQQAKRDTIRSLKKIFMSSGVDDYVFLFFSGHGLLDENLDFYACTNEIDVNNPKQTAVSFDELEYILDSIPSRHKLLIIDACYSGEVDKPEIKDRITKAKSNNGIKVLGAKPFGNGREIKLYRQELFELMNRLFVDIRKRSGTNVLTSSRGVEVSYENDKWQNGLLTYALLSALSPGEHADSNKDGQISVAELLQFIVGKVVQLSEGLQVPTIREENFEFDFPVW